MNLQAEILTARHSGRPTHSPQKLSVTGRPIIHTALDGVQTGHRLGQRSKVQCVGRQTDQRPENLQGGYLCRPKILSRCCTQRGDVQ